MADEIISPDTETAGELTLDQELEALFPGNEKPDTQSGESSEAPKPEETTPKPGPDTSTETPAPSSEEQNPILAKLDEIKAEGEEQPKPEETPKLNPEQQKILEYIPDEKTAQQLVEVAQGHQSFTQAFERGDFEQVEQMFQAWNPAAFDAFLEHVYTKKVASGEWVDRWVGEKEGTQNPQVTRGMQALQRKIQSLEEQLTSRSKQEQEAQTSAQREATVKAYVNHLEGMFDKIEFNKADRRWVLNDIHARVGQDPKVRAAINSGNVNAVNSIFKAAVREYVQRDQADTQKKVEKQAQQEKKVAPVQASPIVETGALPDDIKQVKKGDEDAWLDQQLGKLARTVGLKK